MLADRFYLRTARLCALGLAFLAPWPMTMWAQLDSCTIQFGDFRTQTQGGWGITECTGANPGCYRDAMFDQVFPDGIAIGCAEGNQWVFTTSSAVGDFLPQTATAALLEYDAVNPTGSSGILAGQLLAAKLSIAFDAADSTFGAANLSIGDLQYASGPFEGWSVAAVVMMADMVIGGCMPSVDNLSVLVEALAAFNGSFVDGTMVSGSIVLPGCEDAGNNGSNDDGGDSGGGNGNNGGPNGDDCSGNDVCTVELSCPPVALLSCDADTAAAALGFPAVSITCCPAGAPLGSSECTSASPTLEWNWTDTESGSCPVNITRTFSATLVEAGFDTVITCVQILEIADTTAPEIACPPDVALDCGESLDPAMTGFASAMDACGTVVVTYSDVMLGPLEGGEEGYTRVWVATDACGNEASCLQTITVPDATAPVISLDCPPDTVLDFTGDCDADMPIALYGEPEVTVTDAQDVSPFVSVSYTDVTDVPCAGKLVVTRTWVVTATDACGNEAVAACQQTLIFVDAEAPVIVGTCGIEDGEMIEVCCAPDGSMDIPAPCLITASDNCGVNIDYEETYTGYAPTPGSQQACAATQPVAYENGQTCEGDTTHALRLFCFPGSDEQVAYFTAVGAGEIQYFDDASWSLTWSVMSLDNPNAGFDLSVVFSDGLDWNGWNDRGIPSGFNGECADLMQAQTWMYYILSEGTLTGWGEYTGSSFTLSHQPESTFYGAQLGEGANQHNAQYGFGTTLTYSGDFVENGAVVAADIHCCGDLHGEVECCLPFTITRTYTASDCAGNTSVFSYQISSSGQPCPDAEGGTAERTDALPQGRSATIELSGMAPNPAGGDVSLRFAVQENMEVEAAILNLAGQVVQPLGSYAAEANVEHMIDFHVGALPSGLYQLRLTSSQHKAVRSLMVVH